MAQAQPSSIKIEKPSSGPVKKVEHVAKASATAPKAPVSIKPPPKKINEKSQNKKNNSKGQQAGNKGGQNK
ncbi:hypothetical protein S83_030618 [Arachis hypogaea]|nr:uncharacterized protein DS421_9g286930 [Arachis hypogaea]